MRRILLSFLLWLLLLSVSHSATTTLTSADMAVTIDSSNCKISVAVVGDRTWTQPTVPNNPTCSSLSGDGTTATWTVTYSSYGLSGIPVTATISGKTLEITLGHNSKTLTNDYYFQYPARFLTSAGDNIVMPWGEGFIAPNTDTAALKYSGGQSFGRFYGGFYMSLPLMGVTNGTSGYMMLVETAYDAAYYLKLDGSYLSPEVNWVSQKGTVGYDRKIKYYFYPSNFTYVTMAQLFRAWAEAEGIVVTLDEKAVTRPKVENLKSAGNMYASTSNATSFSTSLASSGADNMLVNTSTYWDMTSAIASAIVANGHIPAAYHNYSESYRPDISHTYYTPYFGGGYTPGTSNFTGYGYLKTSGFQNTNQIQGLDKIQYWKPQWTASYSLGSVTQVAGSPGVFTRNSHNMPNGAMVRLTGTLPTTNPSSPGFVAGTTYYVVNRTANTFNLAYTSGGAAINTTTSGSGMTLYWVNQSYVVSSRFAATNSETDSVNKMSLYMSQRLLSDYYIEATMLDVYTASQLEEDYDPLHPMTRSEDAYYRNEVFRITRDAGLIVGGEEGQWWAVPYVDYFDGLFTNNVWHSYNDNTIPSADYLTYQTGYAYRIPLWELVYHDCVVAYNRWDYNRFEQYYDYNSQQEMKKMRGWMILYGLMPLMRDAYGLSATKYTTGVFPDVGVIYQYTSQVAGVQMTNHEFLNGTKSQQRTTWDNGMQITVDFDAMSYLIEDTTASGVTVTLGSGNFGSMEIY